MKKEFYLSFFVLLSIISQGIGDLSEDNREENIEKSTADAHVRKKRVIDNRYDNNQEHELQEALLYTLSLEKDKVHICGAVPLLSYLVLTATKCVSDGYHPRYRIKAGSMNVNEGTIYNVTRIHIIEHKQKKGAPIRGDLALLFVIDIDFREKTRTRPIRLSDCELKNGTPLIVGGWGRENTREPENPEQDQLHAATVHVTTCHFEDPEGKYLCTEDPSKQNLIQFGTTDVGGPVFANNLLYGIHLTGGHPAVHIKLSNPEYLAWIDEWIRKSGINPYRPYVGTHENKNPLVGPEELLRGVHATVTPAPGTSGTLNPFIPHPANPRIPPNPLSEITPAGPSHQYPPQSYPPSQPYPPPPYYKHSTE